MHLKLTKSAIKNKLFDITTEFKEFEFQLSFQIESLKNDEVFKRNPWFDSEKIEFNDINIDEVLNIERNQFLLRVENGTYEGSGWTINLIIQHRLIISEIAPCEGSSYFPLAKQDKNPMKGLINIQLKDNECFRWRLVISLNPVNKNPAKNTNADNEFAKQLDFKAITLPVHEKDYAGIEKENNIFINVFSYEDETPYCIYTSKQTFEQFVFKYKYVTYLMQ